MKPSKNSLFLTLLTVEGAVSLAVYFSARSETQNAHLLGFSYARLAVGAAVLVLMLVLAGLAVWTARRPEIPRRWLERYDGWANTSGRVWGLPAALLLTTLFLVGAYFFTYLFLPAHLRPVLIWLATVPLQAGAFLAVVNPAVYRRCPFRSLGQYLPSWNNLSQAQKRTAWVLLALSVVYFLAFIPANLKNSRDPHDFMMNGGDEYITYPYVVRMLTPGQTLSQTMYYVFIYEDYHYGYPFYVASALAMLPARLILGNGFADNTAVNLLLLRQMVNVVPIILSALLVTWMWTRFRSTLQAAGLFLLIGFASAVTGFNAFFWHPDGLVVLAMVLALFFLDRDRLRFGWNFVLSAVFCGLASAIKLFGFYFFLAVAGYLVAGLVTRKLSFQRAVRAGLIYVGVMGAVFVFSNPYLFLPEARNRFLHIVREKSGDFSAGFNYDPDGIYRTGWGPWLPFLEYGFGNRWFLGFLAVSLLASCFWGEHRALARLTLAWMLPLGGYLIYLVAVKVTHYWLPAVVPFYGCTFALAELAAASGRKARQAGRSKAWVWQALYWAGIGFPAIFIVIFLLRFRLFV
jgi:hypothetical protein